MQMADKMAEKNQSDLQMLVPESKKHVIACLYITTTIIGLYTATTIIYKEECDQR